MNPEQISHMVALSVSPVVVISASALLCLAFYNRLSAVVARLRAVQRERLDLQDRMERMTTAEIEKNTGLRYTTVLESLSDQSMEIMYRARLIRRTLSFFLFCIACLVVCSLLNGLTVIWERAAVAAVLMFAGGMVCLLCGVSCALLELKHALGPAELEIGVVSELTGFSTSPRSNSGHPASGEFRIA